MSHLKQRHEQMCLNCNAAVIGRFCHVCGQQNIEPKDTFGHLAGHLVSDIFHFDGQFFNSAKYLLFRPGFLTYEYVRGRRASYLNPIKMYVFISAIFFLFFLSVLKPENFFADKKDWNMSVADVREELGDKKVGLEKTLADTATPVLLKKTLQTKLKQVNSDIALLQKDSTSKEAIIDRIDNNIINLENGNYKNIQQYDSLQRSLPANKRDNWLERLLQKRNLAISQKYKGRDKELSTNLVENFLHHFPQMMFISLPLFALILQLLYIRRKRFYYVDHAIYTVHLYCATYIFIFLLLLLSQSINYFHASWLNTVSVVTGCYMLFYSYRAMHNFYGQSRWKTIIKWLLLNAIALFVMLFLFVAMLVFAAFTF